MSHNKDVLDLGPGFTVITPADELLPPHYPGCSEHREAEVECNYCNVTCFFPIDGIWVDHCDYCGIPWVNT